MKKKNITAAYKSHHKIGQDNIKILGLDAHNPVFFSCAGLTLLFVALTLLFPEAMDSNIFEAKQFTLHNFDWLLSFTLVVELIVIVGIALSPLGNIRLGGQDCKPDFGLASWVAMLFAAGVGSGYMFYGAAEPLSYYTNASGIPLDAIPETDAAKRLALSASIAHWGILGWAVYTMMGLSFAFFNYNKGLPLSIRSAFYPLLGERIWGWPGHVIDIFSVVATIFGTSTTLGLGATQVSGGLSYLFGVSASIYIQLLFILVISAIAIFSVVRGIDGGIKLLSNINIAMGFFLLIFVIIAGPTIAIFSGFGVNIKNYLLDLPRLTNWIGREDKDFFFGWTIFYWAWWIAWAPFIGMFIARISKGRTIREFNLVALSAPLIIGVIWFTAFGETAIQQYNNKLGDIADSAGNLSLILFYMLDNLPFATLTSILSLLLILIFITTSIDSGALVIDSITAGGKTNTPTAQKVFWVLMLGVTASVLLYIGGNKALGTLQAGTIVAALPFSVILLVGSFSLILGLVNEHRWLKSQKE